MRNKQFYKMRLLKVSFNIFSNLIFKFLLCLFVPSIEADFKKKNPTSSIYKDKGSKGEKSEVNTEKIPLS